MPGKMTMSDRPRMGRTSGSEVEETSEGTSGLPAAPIMLINSVSGVLMIGPCYTLDAAARNKFREEASPLRQEPFCHFSFAAGSPAHQSAGTRSDKRL